MKTSKLARKVLKNVKEDKKNLSKDCLKNLLGMIRTDCWDEIGEKEIDMICENYRIEATDLLECCQWLFKIANELEKLSKERQK